MFTIHSKVIEVNKSHITRHLQIKIILEQFEIVIHSSIINGKR